MAEIVNLSLARKAKARSEAERTAAHNRAAHGRSKAERAGTAAESERMRRHLDGARRAEDDRSERNAKDENGGDPR